ncbi:hypothetical protein pb186bvf_018135 [Paramecium bursaria]
MTIIHISEITIIFYSIHYLQNQNQRFQGIFTQNAQSQYQSHLPQNEGLARYQQFLVIIGLVPILNKGQKLINHLERSINQENKQDMIIENSKCYLQT